MFKTLSAALLLATASSAMAVINNGHFESWSGNAPDGWTTIDSGISIAPSASSHGGSSAAAIAVNTGSQSSTDLRQSVDVVNGTSYDFSVWVYHTEGHLKARLYVDGYQNYSSNTQTNQWQQISYRYTANTTGSIEVGLRFYDQSGFDGSELVYVDDFMPTSSTTGGGSTGGNNGGNSNTCVGTQINLTTDNYGSETSWAVTDSNGTEVASGSGYGNNQNITDNLCLEPADYAFTINDQYGDGICCSYGNGSYSVLVDGVEVASGGQFNSTETRHFTVLSDNGGNNSGGNNNGGSTGNTDLSGYYASANGLTGYALKSELHNIIDGHNARGYSALWTFYDANSRDVYFENDGTILDIYSENPNGTDPYSYTSTSDQCGSYSGEGSCYNREHSFPRSWFGGSVEPMNSDVHHIFATDGYVNGRRSSYPYGEVGSATYTSQNGSKVGSSTSGLGYSGTVFEPIDEFKGDLARAYFYMATRYEGVIANWENNSSYGDAVLNGSSNQVFEAWFLNMLLSWHTNDPVSQKEINRNEAAYNHQGNRNPFVDHPELVDNIWGN
jgi:endonuclease I